MAETQNSDLKLSYPLDLYGSSCYAEVSSDELMKLAFWKYPFETEVFLQKICESTSNSDIEYIKSLHPLLIP